MSSDLQRLLDAEARAEAIVAAADQERQRIIDQTLAEVAAAEARFEASLAQIRAPFIEEAEARAEQGVAELKRKYEERQHALRELAERHEAEAIEAGLAMLIDPAW